MVLVKDTARYPTRFAYDQPCGSALQPTMLPIETESDYAAQWVAVVQALLEYTPTIAPAHRLLTL